jgi:hypothetical protein
MTTLRFPYIERSHTLFGTIKRPLLTLFLHSDLFDQWLILKDVLVDTGADISVIPLSLGQIIVDYIEHGEPIYLGGRLSSGTMFNAFVHRVQAKLGDISLEIPVAIALSDTIPPILGRREALDRFNAYFVNGQELVLNV